MRCLKCGKSYSYASADIKSGRITHPELCPECSKVGKVETMTETAEEPKEKYFKAPGIEGKKRKRKKEEPEAEKDWGEFGD